MSASRVVSTSSPSMLRIVAVLKEHGPMAGRELCKMACIAFDTFNNREYKGRLLNDRLIHICDYKSNKQGPHSPIFDSGPGPDDPVTPPRALSASTKCRAWRERSGYNEAYNESRRAERLRKKPADPVLCALMGIPS